MASVWVVSFNGEPYAVFDKLKAAKSYSKDIEGEIKELGMNDTQLVKDDGAVKEATNSVELEAPASAVKKATTSAVKEAPSSTVKKAPVKKPSKRATPAAEDEEDDDVDEEKTAPAKKKAKPAQKKAEDIPDGIPGALAGAVIGMTGTACLTRDTLKVAVDLYGGSYTEKCETADYVVVGKRAGDKKLQALKDGGVKQITDTQLLAFFQGEEPDVDE